MVDAAPIALILVNKEAIIAYLNIHAEKLFGYTKSELIGKQIDILIPDKIKKHHADFVKYFFTSPNARAMGEGRELFAVKKDGSEFPVEIGLNPIVSIQGTLVLAAIIDISERKKFEERFRLVVESAPNSMVLVDISGTIIFVNKQTEKLFEYSREELIGNKIEILIPSEYKYLHPTYRNDFFENPKARAMGIGRELFALKKNGQKFPVEIGLNPIETSDGLKVLASIIDISERKLQELAHLKQIELESKNVELEQFAFIVSHDLREPLRTFNNYMQIIEEDYIHLLDERALKYLNSMQNSVIRMDHLIEALLEYSRLGRKQDKEIVDLNLILKNVLNDLDNLIKSCDIEFDIGKLPSINVYPSEIGQLFQNLISNSIKFRNKEIKLKIKISAEFNMQKWKFTFSDNGIGIEEKYFKRIFQIFQRLHSREEYDGYGIGLSFCKKIIELHNGEIWLESEFNKGTTFFFTIENKE